jgi:hypothetical protein
MRQSRRRQFGFLSLLVLTTTVTGIGISPLVQTVAAAPGTHAPRISVPKPAGTQAVTSDQPWTARNWSGYALDDSSYTDVVGSWTVPTVNAPQHHKKARQYSATWVGIDGFNGGSDLIQAGTEQDWANGTASYGAWWEILPAPETPIASITVHPDDNMTVSIAQGSPDWTITVTDVTTGQSFTTKKIYGGEHSSAEWIQEAPTVGRKIAALAHDSTVDFTGLLVNGANPGLTTADAGEMVKGGKVISTPSSPNAAQNGFAVAFGDIAPPPPSG